jgi:hypothetical protein
MPEMEMTRLFLYNSKAIVWPLSHEKEIATEKPEKDALHEGKVEDQIYIIADFKITMSFLKARNRPESPLFRI